MNKEPDDITSVIILDRSMNREEFKTMYPPHIPLREKLLFRMIYKTSPDTCRDWRPGSSYGNAALVRSPSRRQRASTTSGPGATFVSKTMELTENTSEILRHYVGNRKEGHIFIKPCGGSTI